MESAITGNLGEKLAARFLVERGFKITETNYRKKWGEIDIVAEKDGILHFVEVKATASVYPETPARNASHSDAGGSGYRPEENVRLWKKQRRGRAIKTYLLDRNISDEKEFLIDVIALNLDFFNKKAKVRWVKDVLLEE